MRQLPPDFCFSLIREKQTKHKKLSARNPSNDAALILYDQARKARKSKNHGCSSTIILTALYLLGQILQYTKAILHCLHCVKWA